MKPWDGLGDPEKDREDFRMAAFAGMVDRVDQNVGKLVAELERTGALENTILFFLSDNGACPFERSKHTDLPPWDPGSYWTYDTSWAHACNTPFRLYKQNQHEGGISTPLIVHWPRGLKVKGGSITHQPGHLVDIMATCLEAAGSSYPESFEGRPIKPLRGKSLLPIFGGERRAGHETIYFQFSSNRAVRQGRWKLVSARGGPWELYDIEADRTEMNNLASSEPDRVARMAELWENWAREVGLGQRSGGAAESGSGKRRKKSEEDPD